MKTEALVKLREYWESLRKGRLAPYRAELDPRQFEDVLEHMFILEQLSPSQVRIRLAGMALCEMMGMEVRGMPPEAFIDAAHRPAFAQHLSAVLTGPSVVELDLRAEDTLGRPLIAQMLLLPLRSDFGEVTRILGCVIAGGNAAVRAPVNFEITAHRCTTILVEGLEPDSGARRGEMPGFAEPAADFSRRGTDTQPPLRTVASNPDAVSSGPRRGHLRVIRGD